MLNIDLILTNNSYKKSTKKSFSISPKKHIIYTVKHRIVTTEDILYLCQFANVIKLLPYKLMPIDIFFKEKTKFKDKLIYILTECILYSMINSGYQVNVFIKSYEDDIYTEGFQYSPILTYKQDTTKYSRSFFIGFSDRHYRRVVKLENNYDNYLVSSIMQDIDSFLKYFMIEDECRFSISQVVSELVDNSLDHGQSDCLIDLDITTEYIKINNLRDISTNDKYYGVNISVVNFSNLNFGEKLKQKIYKSCFNDLDDRHKTIITAHNKHKLFWNERYDEDAFYILSSFQHKISGRLGRKTGGTGLTKLIKTLEERSEAYNCYMMSGNKKIIFPYRFLKYDNGNWIGLNENNDYLNFPPDDNCFFNNNLYIPGVAYNLNFILRRDEKYNEEN